MKIASKIKWGVAALKFAKHFPKLGLFGAIAAISYFGFTYLDNQAKHNALIKEQVEQLIVQNQQLKEANTALAEDSKTIKEGVEKLSKSLVEIKNKTSSLSKQFEDAKFKELLKKDLPKAESSFNEMFNDYFQDINKDTQRYEK